MQRVAIIGPGGAGKSTLARQLGAISGLRVIHLDREYWRPGWVETPGAEWVPRVDELAAAERWIIDGNYGGTLQIRLARADTVVYLDFERRSYIWRVLRRRFQYRDRGRSRPDMADGCEETIDWKFLQWLLTYPAKRRAETLGLLAAAHREGKRVVILRDAAQVRAFAEQQRAGVVLQSPGLQRVNVVGAAGAGKSTLATPLGSRLGLPHADVGALLGAAGHSRSGFHEHRHIVERATDEPRWILEGTYWRSLALRLAAGDVAMFLDRSSFTRARRIIGRRRKGGGAASIRAELGVIFWSLGFPFRERRRVLRTLGRAAPGQPVFIIRTDREASAVLEGLAPAPEN